MTCAQPSLCYLIVAVGAFRAYEICLFNDIVYLTLQDLGHSLTPFTVLGYMPDLWRLNAVTTPSSESVAVCCECVTCLHFNPYFCFHCKTTERQLLLSLHQEWVNLWAVLRKENVNDTGKVKDEAQPSPLSLNFKCLESCFFVHHKALPLNYINTLEWDK